MRVHDLADDGEAEAGALGLGREERVEDFVGHLRHHARAIVGHIDDDGGHGVMTVRQQRTLGGRGGERRRDDNAAAAIERFIRVDQQVGEHLRQLIRVRVE